MAEIINIAGKDYALLYRGPSMEEAAKAVYEDLKAKDAQLAQSSKGAQSKAKQLPQNKKKV